MPLLRDPTHERFVWPQGDVHGALGLHDQAARADIAGAAVYRHGGAGDVERVASSHHGAALSRARRNTVYSEPQMFSTGGNSRVVNAAREAARPCEQW